MNIIIPATMFVIENFYSIKRVFINMKNFLEVHDEEI